MQGLDTRNPTPIASAAARTWPGLDLATLPAASKATRSGREEDYERADVCCALGTPTNEAPRAATAASPDPTGGIGRLSTLDPGAPGRPVPSPRHPVANTVDSFVIDVRTPCVAPCRIAGRPRSHLTSGRAVDGPRQPAGYGMSRFVSGALGLVGLVGLVRAAAGGAQVRDWRPGSHRVA